MAQTCLCQICETCKARLRKREYRAKLKAAETPVPRKPRKPSRSLPEPTHARALRFNAKTRPFDPADAADHIVAVFVECPNADKPHLLARIKMLVRQMEAMWGGFRFPDIPEPINPHRRTDSPDH
jgi:hypothetical protein